MGRIGRTKRFDVKPMTPQEAIAELEAIGHEFFLFYHAGLDQYAVLYRRRAGDYGLIVPELS
jgi:putative sigma-54 modulation protein